MTLKNLLLKINRLIQAKLLVDIKENPQLLIKGERPPTMEQAFEEYNHCLQNMVNLASLATMNNELCLTHMNDCVKNLEEGRNRLEKVKTDQKELKKEIFNYAVERALNEREEIY